MLQPVRPRPVRPQTRTEHPTDRQTDPEVASSHQRTVCTERLLCTFAAKIVFRYFHLKHQWNIKCCPEGFQQLQGHKNVKKNKKNKPRYFLWGCLGWLLEYYIFFEKIRQREGELGRRHVTRGLQVVIWHFTPGIFFFLIQFYFSYF